MAMDETPYEYLNQNALYSGQAFLGYPFLAMLTQQPEYRKMTEVIAKEMTRKWIKVCASGDEDKSEKVAKIEAALKKFKMQALFRKAAELDGFFGRGQIFIDVKSPKGGPARNNPSELESPLLRDPAKVPKGSLLGFRVIEPVWTYPSAYNANNPLAPDYFKPSKWYVMGQTVHTTRLLMFVSREVPDLLKAAYNFGGVSMSQLAQPYVNNWIRTRDSVSDLVHSFSINGVKTDMSSVLQGGAGQELFARLEVFNKMRDNRGAFVLDKDMEEFFQFNTPLSGLDALQAQAQEQMASVSNIALVKLTGITPAGLNASSDGEIRVFYDFILSLQEMIFTDNLTQVLELIQLSEFGEIDEDINFEFVPLYQLDEVQQATVRKTDADADAVMITSGVISPDDARRRISGDPESRYHGLEVNEDLGDGDDEEDDQQLEGRVETVKGKPAQDSGFEEGKHPRDEDGKFGSGAGTGSVKLKGDELGQFSDMKELRKKAMDFASRFVGKKFTNKETGNEIQVSKSGVKHTIAGASDELVRSIPAIPEMLENSTLVSSEEEEGGDPNILAVETYSSPLEIGGKSHTAILTVKQYRDGRRYYDHGLIK